MTASRGASRRARRSRCSARSSPGPAGHWQDLAPAWPTGAPRCPSIEVLFVFGAWAGGLPAASRELPVVADVQHQVVALEGLEGRVDLVGDVWIPGGAPRSPACRRAGDLAGNPAHGAARSNAAPSCCPGRITSDLNALGGPSEPVTGPPRDSARHRPRLPSAGEPRAGGAPEGWRSRTPGCGDHG